jgi:hypothetical protein
MEAADTSLSRKKGKEEKIQIRFSKSTNPKNAGCLSSCNGRGIHKSVMHKSRNPLPLKKLCMWRAEVTAVLAKNVKVIYRPQNKFIGVGVVTVAWQFETKTSLFFLSDWEVHSGLEQE